MKNRWKVLNGEEGQLFYGDLCCLASLVGNAAGPAEAGEGAVSGGGSDRYVGYVDWSIAGNRCRV